MANAGRKFSDFQIDGRYKRLELALKLASIKSRRTQVMENQVATRRISLPSVSTIAVDESDYSFVSRTGGDVVSASNNLRKIGLVRKDLNNEHPRITTSGVKRYHSGREGLDDRSLMPPPDFSPPNGTRTSFPVYSQSRSNGFQNRGPVTFTQWTVVLDNLDQLIITGVVDSGKVVRSQPVIKRLTATCVQSRQKYLYYLEGNIFDGKGLLPDYIRNKFYNGFPEDWENDHEVWRSYAQGGRLQSFRWPTPISDSDDDLKSEMTDVSVFDLEDDDCSLKSLNSYARKPTVSSKNSSNTLQHRNERSCNSYCSVSMNDSSTQTSIRDREETLCYTPKMDPMSDRNISNKENYGSRNIWKNIKPKLEGILQRDKLNIIIKNLVDENCPQEYIHTIDRIFDDLNYAVSYDSSVSVDSSNVTLNESRNRTVTLSKQSPRRSITGDVRRSEVISKDISTTTNTQAQQEKLLSPRAAKKINCDESFDNSESATYAGIPRVSVERILQKKEPLSKQCTRKRKKRSYVDTPKGVANQYSVIGPSNRNRNRYDPYESCEAEYSNVTNPRNNLKQQWSDVDNKVNRHSGYEIRTKSNQVNSQDKYTNERDQTNYKNGCLPCDRDVSKESPSRGKNAISRSKPTVLSSMPAQINVTLINDQKYQPVNRSIKELDVAATIKPEKKEEKDSQANVKMESTSFSSPPKHKIHSDRQSSKTKIDAVKPNYQTLTGWMPKVVHCPELNSELGLIFKGKLLNDAGRVVDRKFKTDIVLQRISPRLIETINHEFYQLEGDVCDTGHVVPKQLFSKCRFGCPSRIGQFCATWNLLQPVRKHNTSIDNLDYNVSSRGRRIIPPLNYWIGERITSAGGEVVYDQGTTYNSLENPEKSLRNTSVKSICEESGTKMNKPVASGNSTIKKANDSNKSKNIANRKSMPSRRRVGHSSTDSSDGTLSPTRKRRRITVSQEDPMRKSRRTIASTGVMTRSRELDSHNFKSTNHRRSGNQHNTHLTYTFYGGMPSKDDVLSEDQLSQI